MLSIAISLFWLVALVAAHFAREWGRQMYEARSAGDRPGFRGLLLRVLWELKLDLALIVFALVLTVYMEMALGLVGLGAVGRSGAMATARVGSRFAVLQRVLRGVLLSLDDAAQVARAILNPYSAEALLRPMKLPGRGHLCLSPTASRAGARRGARGITPSSALGRCVWPYSPCPPCSPTMISGRCC